MTDKIQVANLKNKTAITRDMTAEESGQREADIALVEAEILPAKIAAIKEEASRRILEMYPPWKQANMNAEATSLQEIRWSGDPLSPAQEVRRDELKAAWGVIAGIRQKSNEIEASLEGKTSSEIAVFDPKDPAHWA